MLQFWERGERGGVGGVGSVVLLMGAGCAGRACRGILDVECLLPHCVIPTIISVGEKCNRCLPAYPP